LERAALGVGWRCGEVARGMRDGGGAAAAASVALQQKTAERLQPPLLALLNHPRLRTLFVRLALYGIG